MKETTAKTKYYLSSRLQHLLNHSQTTRINYAYNIEIKIDGETTSIYKQFISRAKNHWKRSEDRAHTAEKCFIYFFVVVLQATISHLYPCLVFMFQSVENQQIQHNKNNIQRHIICINVKQTPRFVSVSAKRRQRSALKSHKIAFTIKAFKVAYNL